MKWLCNIALGALSVLVFVPAVHAEVFGVKTVYILPMARGLDQYLALQLTTQGVLQVVTDPKKADAVLTDGVGARFEETLTAMYGAPVDKDQSEKDSKTEFSHPATQRLSSSAGVVFLVNRVSRDVLWSTFEHPKNTRPEDMKNTAKKIVERLAKSNSPGKSHD